MRCDAFPKRRAKSFVQRAFSFLGTLPKASNGEPLQITEEIWIDRWKEKAKRQITEVGYDNILTNHVAIRRREVCTEQRGRIKRGKGKKVHREYTGNLNVRGIVRSTLNHLGIIQTTIMIHRGNAQTIRCIKPEMFYASFMIFQLSYRSPIWKVSIDAYYARASFRVIYRPVSFSVTLRNIEFPIYVLSGRD